jgi:hypothetical protein
VTDSKVLYKRRSAVAEMDTIMLTSAIRYTRLSHAGGAEELDDALVFLGPGILATLGTNIRNDVRNQHWQGDGQLPVGERFDQ